MLLILLTTGGMMASYDPLHSVQGSDEELAASLSDQISLLKTELARKALEFHQDRSTGEVSVSNSQQGYDARIDGSNFRLELHSNDHWVEFNMKGVGRKAGVQTRMQTGPALIDGDRLVMPFTGLDMEWLNSALGLRQNFILHKRPAGSGEVSLRLLVRSDLRPALQDENTLQLLNKDSDPILNYHDLRIWDAHGKELAGHMELHDEELVLVFHDDDATYPITVDPISTTPNRLIVSTFNGSDFGISVGSAGDLNGDGYSDVVIGAWKASLGQVGEGAAFVYYGSVNGIPPTAAVILQSNQVNAQFGAAVATAGDVNGDGYSDLMVGASTWENSGAQVSEGAVFFYYGSATGITTVEDVRIETDHAGDLLGANIAPAGDLNGDGYSDVILGAYLSQYTVLQQGAVFIHLGSATGINPTFSHRMLGFQTGAHFGRSVAGAGDINGDGYSDVIVGSPRVDIGATNNGAAYVYYGSATALGPPFPGPDLVITGNGQVDGRFGWSVACAGDVNGDGYSDVAVGAYNNYDDGQVQEGHAYVFHGAAAGLTTTPAIVLESDQDLAWMGRCVATAGDMNGDGYSDLIVGIPRYSAGQTQEGVCRLYLGSPSGITAPHYIQFELNDAGSLLGESVIVAGDVNGDGYSDVIMGARIYGTSGAAAIFHGGPYYTSTSPTLSRSGTNANDRMGTSVSIAGDVNGDGYSDVIIGAPNASNGQASEGQAYVHLGSANGMVATPHRTLEPNVAGQLFGTAVSTAGDVNGDGYSDVIVGAPGAAAGAGITYLYMGGPGGLSATPALMITGAPGSGSGSALSTAGDVNIDGYADVIIGCNASGNRAAIHVGSSIGLSATPQVTLTGTGGFGSAVNTAGDVNGDGASDIVIGAPTQGSGGAAYVHHGSLSGISATADIQLNGPVAGGQFGYSITSIDDHDGDGYSDIAIGAPQWANGQVGEGGVFVYYGSGAGISATASILEYNTANAHLGSSVSSAGDINGDGYSDLVVGLPDISLGEADEGAALVFRGHFTGTLASPTLLQTDVADQHFGASVAGVGDVDGDGYSDVMAGAPQANLGLADQGVAHIFHGNLDGNMVRRTRQYLSNLTSPLSVNSMDYGNIMFFGIGQFCKSHIHRSPGRLVWEVVHEGDPFSGLPINHSVSSTGQSATWTDLGVSGVEIKELMLKNVFDLRYKWRVRLEQHPSMMIDGQRYGRWFYGYASGHADIGVLPIELIHFAGEPVDKVNRLEWVTVTEHNSDHFLVERSSNGVEFEVIGQHEAAGNHNGQIDYEFFDSGDLPPMAYYRLRMVDQDGSFEYSDVITIARPDQHPVIFPVPVDDQLNVVLPQANGASKLEVFDATGRAVLRHNLLVTDQQRHLINTAQLPSGQYTLVVQDAKGNALSRTPFVK